MLTPDVILACFIHLFITFLFNDIVFFLTIPHYVIGNFGRQINFPLRIPRLVYIQYIFILIAFSFNKNCLLEIEIIFKAIAMNDKCIECVAVLLLGGPKIRDK